MFDDEPDSGETQACLQRMWTRDDKARQELFAHLLPRVKQLVEHMLRAFPIVRRHEQADDVVQRVMLRLLRALDETRPQSKRELLGLAAVAIRRELLDLAKYWRTLEAARAVSSLADLCGDSEGEGFEPAAPPVDFVDPEKYTRLHELVEFLPAHEREVVNLLYYAGRSHEEAAELLGVSVRTVRRRWQSAREILRRQLLPPSPR